MSPRMAALMAAHAFSVENLFYNYVYIGNMHFLDWRSFETTTMGGGWGGLLGSGVAVNRKPPSIKVQR
jgi:hypothetical protein